MDRLLNVDEIAERLRTTPSTIRHWVATSQGPPSARIGRRRMWRESEVERWLDEKFKAQAG